MQRAPCRVSILALKKCILPLSLDDIALNKILPISRYVVEKYRQPLQFPAAIIILAVSSRTLPSKERACESRSEANVRSNAKCAV